MKRYSLIILFLLTIFGCKNQEQAADSNQDVQPQVVEAEIEKEQVDGLPNHPEFQVNQPEIPVSYDKMDTSVRNKIIILDSLYVSTPYYSDVNGYNLFVVSNKKWKYGMERFGGDLNYGVVDDNLELLVSIFYDKIYNPDLTLKDHFEIKKDGLVGMVNYRTGFIIEPQFDFIMPDGPRISQVAYGYKDQGWYKIEDDIVQESDFDPSNVLIQLNFSVTKVGSSMMYDSYNGTYENDPEMGRGVVMVPSYIEYLGLSENEYYLDIILPDQEKVDFGLESAGSKYAKNHSITDKLVAFFISFYESGIDARGYQMGATQLVIYQNQNNNIKSSYLVSDRDYNLLCLDPNYRFINDSILEVSTYNAGSHELYNHETRLEYKKILSDGNIIKLSSNRHFDFTKFTIIDESYFAGCFINYIDYEEETDFNIVVADHLSIEDLDIMRNEIFADYGYRFKSEKWSSYFTKLPWYRPLYDNVDDKLTDIDKANIKTILMMKEKMKGREEEFTMIRKSTFYAAG